MTVNTVSVITYYICLFLSVLIVFCNTDETRRYKCIQIALVFSLSKYAYARWISNPLVCLPWPVLFAVNLVASEIINLAAVKTILKSAWLDCLIQSCIFSVFQYSVSILNALLIYGLIPELSRKYLPVILSLLVSTVIMMLWCRKTVPGTSHISAVDQIRLLIILICLVVFENRLFVAYMNTLDNTLGFLTLIVPVLITTVLKKNVMEEHYVIEQGRLRAFDHLAKNELKALNQYETVLTKTRHELINHLNIIRGYAEQDNKEQLDEYISRIIKDNSGNSVFEYSDNIYINTIIKYLKGIYPKLDIQVEAMIGNDCPTDPLDLGMIVLCLSESSFAVLPEGCHILLTVRQVEDMVIISESADGVLLNEVLSETDYSILEEILGKYHGSLNFNIKVPGDITVLLSCDKPIGQYYDHLDNTP